MKTPKTLVLVLLILFVLSSTVACARIVFVSTSGNDANTGDSWQAAKRTIEGGLAAAVNGDQVWVAKGSYNASASITIPKGVQLYGGFSGAETDLNQRPPFPRPHLDINTTRIDGNVIGVFVVALDADAATRLDGFTIFSWGTGSLYNRFGGAIRCLNSSPTIANNTILSAGFQGLDYGGAIYCNGASPIITGNRIIRCWATYGGAIYCNCSSPIITNNVITGNFGASDHATGGSQYGPGYGGAIYCDNQSSPTIANNIIGANSASSGGAIYCKNGSAPLIANNTITSNYSQSGGNVYLDGSSPTLVNNIIAFNSSGVFSSAPGPLMRNNCVFNLDGANYSGISPGPGDISLNPLLQCVEYGKAHVQPESPCIDAGDSSVVQQSWRDMDGGDRILGAGVDIGADESNGARWDPTPTIIRVSTTGNDNNDGSSWDKAIRSPMWASMSLETTGGEIWIAGGTYRDGEYSVIPKAYISLYGGFSGSETSIEQRDFRTNTTILGGAEGPNLGGGYRATRLDGFTVANSVLCVFSGPVVTNNTLRGITVLYGAPLVTRNTITGRRISSGSGGGLSWDHSAGEISDNSISNNLARFGGGVYCSYSSPLITRNTISANTSSNGGGGIYCDQSSPQVLSNTITGNSVSTSPSYGGGGIQCVNYSTPLISDNTISGNTAGYGGGLWSTTYSNPTILNNVVSGNTGGGLNAYAFTGAVTILNNTICGNTYSSSGAGMKLGRKPGADLIVANNTVAFNSSGISAMTGTTWIEPTLSNNCVYNPTGANYTNLSPGPGDISADPLFVDRANGDYHLTVVSPCVNAGSLTAGLPDTDMDGEPRVIYGAVDIGADECALKAARITDAKAVADNVEVDIDQAIISAAFPDAFYIESDLRQFGIRVEKESHGLSEGARADVEGFLYTNDRGERCIEASLAEPNGAGSVRPLGMANNRLGGRATGNQDATWRYKNVLTDGQYVRTWAEADGLNNIGLLVKIYGKVTTAGRDWFYIDDGSGMEDRSGLIGIYVDAAGLDIPAQGSFVSVTGISSCDIYAGCLVNTLLPRNQDDIIVIPSSFRQ